MSITYAQYYVNASRGTVLLLINAEPKTIVMYRIGNMDYRMKRRMGIISILPLLAYISWLIHTLIIMQGGMSMSTQLSQNYGGALFFFILCFAITSAVLIYFVIHIARLVSMNSLAKIGWIMFMTFAAPIACPVFWLVEIRHEPTQLPMHPDIA